MMEKIDLNTYETEYGMVINELDEYKVSMSENIIDVKNMFFYYEDNIFYIDLLKGSGSQRVFDGSSYKQRSYYTIAGVPDSVETNPNHLDYIKDGRIQFYAYGQFTYEGNNWAGIELHIYWVRLKLNVEGYGFTDQNFPEIDIRTSPVSNFPDKPISHLSTKFSIYANTQSRFGTNTIEDEDMDIYIQGDSWSSGWFSMDKSAIENDWVTIIDPHILGDGFGNYSVWVRSTDSGGLSTLESFDFRYDNEAPEVSITFPSNNEVMNSITDYPFSIEIYDLENNNLDKTSASYQIYDDNDNPIFNGWQPMLVDDQPDHFDDTKGENGVNVYLGTGSFDPVSLGIGDYTFVARVEDVGYSIYIGEHFGYGEANFTISNEQPQIEFVDPNIQDPESRKIKKLYGYIVNISIERKIRTGA